MFGKSYNSAHCYSSDNNRWLMPLTSFNYQLGLDSIIYQLNDALQIHTILNTCRCPATSEQELLIGNQQWRWWSSFHNSNAELWGWTAEAAEEQVKKASQDKSWDGGRWAECLRLGQGSKKMMCNIYKLQLLITEQMHTTTIIILFISNKRYGFCFLQMNGLKRKYKKDAWMLEIMVFNFKAPMPWAKARQKKQQRIGPWHTLKER